MRFILLDRWGSQIRTITGISSATWTEELNGEDTLEIVTTCELAKGQRVVWCDQQGVWHEHIVASVTAEHSGGAPSYAATCENSISELYGDWVSDKRPSGSASVALRAALETSRWTVGEVTVDGSHSASFYRTSAREALQTVVKTWGGELSTTIVVSGTKVASRRVNLGRRGSDNGRRFTYGRDMTRIARTVDSDDVVTALYGFGKGEEVGDGHGRGIDFADVNNGKQYVEDLEALEVWGRPDGSGGKAHVFGKFEAPDCDDPTELKRLTEEDLERRKEPRVSYEAEVSTFADYGYDFSGVALGDDVALVDEGDGFSFRAKGRVTRTIRDLLDDGKLTDITMGNIVEGIDGMLAGQYEDLKSLADRATAWDVAAATPSAYIQQIMDGLNRRFDEGASYVYQSMDKGIIIGSVPLDPATGAPTSLPASAIQLAGGGLRIADSLKGDGTWNWRTFGTGEGFTADLILTGTLTAGLITAGVLSDSKGNNYWDLDNGVFSLSAGTTVGGQTVQEHVDGAVEASEEYADEVGEDALQQAKDYTDGLDESLDQLEVFDRLTNGGQCRGIYLTNGDLYINGTYIKSGTIDANLLRAGVIEDASGKNRWDLASGNLNLSGDITMSGGRIQGANGSYWDLDTGEMDLSFTPAGMLTQDDLDAAIGGVETEISGLSSQIGTAQSTANSAKSAASAAQSAANSAQSTANSANSKATSAKAKTDRITFTSSGMTVQGTDGSRYTAMTYGSDGIVSAGAMTGISTDYATLGIKDWGFVFQNDESTARFWVSNNRDEIFGRTNSCSFLVNSSGMWVNNKKVVTE